MTDAQCDRCGVFTSGFPKGWEVDHASGLVFCPECAAKDAKERIAKRKEKRA